MCGIRTARESSNGQMNKEVRPPGLVSVVTEGTLKKLSKPREVRRNIVGHQLDLHSLLFRYPDQVQVDLNSSGPSPYLYSKHRTQTSVLFGDDSFVSLLTLYRKTSPLPLLTGR